MENSLVKVVVTSLYGDRIPVVAGRRKDPLPPKLAAGIEALARQGVGKLDPAGAANRCLLSFG